MEERRDKAFPESNFHPNHSALENGHYFSVLPLLLLLLISVDSFPLVPLTMPEPPLGAQLHMAVPGDTVRHHNLGRSSDGTR